MEGVIYEFKTAIGKFEASLGISFPWMNTLNLSVEDPFMARLRIYILLVTNADHLSTIGFNYNAI